MTGLLAAAPPPPVPTPSSAAEEPPLEELAELFGVEDETPPHRK
jgi:hypothetical protein